MCENAFVEIIKPIAVLKEYPTGWKKEVNLVSWEGRKPKYDIREWDPEHVHMCQGITLTEEEMDILVNAILRTDEREE